MIALLRGSTAAGGFFSGWRDAFVAYRQTKTWQEKVFLFVLLGAYVLRGGLLGFIMLFVSTMGLGIGALCGWDIGDVLEHLRPILNDFYRFARGEPPPQ